VSPAYNNEVFERAGVHKVFFLLLLLIVIGEFFRSVADLINSFISTTFKWPNL
jgi:ABC-type enterochelin transport system permease subunit